MNIKGLLFQLCMLCTFSGFAQQIKTDSLLTVLKSELSKESIYDLQKQKRINVLRHKLLSADSKNFDAQFNLYSKLFEEYRSFKFDSAFAYLRKMISISEKYPSADKLIESKLQLGYTLQNAGLYKEAFDVLDELDTSRLSRIPKTSYLILRARLNAGIADYDNDAYFSNIYHQQSRVDFKRAETTTPANDFEKTINMAFLPDSLKHKELTPAFFYNLVVQRKLPEHITAMAATRISYAYTGENRILFLALAAINDIRSSTKETLAIFLLGQELFKLNRTSDAYIFIQEAVRDAKFYGSRNRAIQIESVLPLVSSKLLSEKQHERDQLLIGVLAFLIVAVLLFFLLVIYRRQMLQIKANATLVREKNTQMELVYEKLLESSRIKEGFLGLFFTTCSSYIEALDTTKRKIQHNIKLGKYNDANLALDNIKIDKEKKQLYKTLDNILLTLFPNFISSFNALLKAEDQIWPKQGETLNATLRIFALMRLGVNDLETIAKILDYSVSTVYTYRHRIKSKALIPPDDFEKTLMEVKYIDNRK
jgi:hypothetical protein